MSEPRELPTEYPRERLSISVDDGLPVILYVPFRDRPEHEHICLTREAAVVLNEWLSAYLNV
jgi:hypothetical protein